MFRAWLRRRSHRQPRRRCRARLAPWPARGLHLEPLEDRWLLSAGPASTLSLIPGLSQAPYTPVVLLDLTSQGSTFVFSTALPAIAFPTSLPTPLFRAFVSWGDGSQSAGALTAAGATPVSIIGSHTYEAPSGIPPVQPAGASAPLGKEVGPASPPAVVVTLTVDMPRTPAAGLNSGQVLIQISLEGFGDQSRGNGPARIDIQVHVLLGAAPFDGTSLVDASAALADSADHLPPVPPIPPGVVGPPWKPRLPETLPGLPPPDRTKGTAANPPALKGSNVPAIVADPPAVRDTTLTAPPADLTKDPPVEWLRGRARDLITLLQAGPDKPASVDEPGKPLGEGIPGLDGPPAAAVPPSRPRADDPVPRRRANRQEPAADRLVPEDPPRAAWGAALFPPDVPMQEPAAAPATYFGQLDPAEEAEHEAALAPAGGDGPPAPRRVGLSYRLLLVGYALWSMCWLRHGRLTREHRPIRSGEGKAP